MNQLVKWQPNTHVQSKWYLYNDCSSVESVKKPVDVEASDTTM